MKKRYAAVLAMALSILMAFSASAGKWIEDGNGWWFQNDDGSWPAGGIYRIGNANYAFNEYGYMVENAWYQHPSSGRWFYALDSGALAQSQWVGNYYVGNDGAMMTNAWIDGYYVDDTGKRVEDASYVDPDIYAPEDPDISLRAVDIVTDPDWLNRGSDYVDSGSSGGSSWSSGSSDNSWSGSNSNWYSWDSNYDQTQNQSQSQSSSGTSSKSQYIPADDEVVAVEQ